MPKRPHWWSTVHPEFEHEFDRLAHQYSGARLSGGYIRTSLGFELFRGVLRFTRRDDSFSQLRSSIQVAPDFHLRDSFLEVDAAHRLVWDAQLRSVQLESTNLHVGPFFEQSVDYSFIAHTTLPMELRAPQEWPHRNFTFDRSRKHEIAIPRSISKVTSSGTAGGIDQILASWTGDSRVTREGEPISFLRVVLPDFRARLSSIEYDSKELYITTQNVLVQQNQTRIMTGLGPANLLSPVASNRPNKAGVSVEKYEAPALYVSLILRDENEVLDWTRIPFDGTNSNPRVKLLSEGERIRRLIVRGEGEHLEFKAQVGDGDELIESVCAFANTSGGTILIGIDDDGTLLGTDARRQQERIGNLLHAKCDPPASLNFHVETLDEKELLVIEVSPGKNRPYVFRPKGVVYLRHDASDRPATRAELDDLYRPDAGEHDTRAG